MNRLGMIVDISYASKETMKAVFNTTNVPVIFSHSSAFGQTPDLRNVDDEILELLVRAAIFAKNLMKICSS